MRLGAGVALVLWALAGCGSSAPERAGAEPAPAERAVGTGAEEQGSEAERMRAALGPELPLADRSPNLLRGDFNGDGTPDLLAVVVLRGAAVPRHVRVEHPWPAYDGALPAGAPPREEEVGLAVIHGGAPGREQVYLLRDLNPVSILDAGAARELAVISAARAAESAGLPARPRGDVIVVPTEAGIDTYLYWTGSGYAFHAPLEEP